MERTADVSGGGLIQNQFIRTFDRIILRRIQFRSRGVLEKDGLNPRGAVPTIVRGSPCAENGEVAFTVSLHDLVFKSDDGLGASTACCGRREGSSTFGQGVRRNLQNRRQFKGVTNAIVVLVAQTDPIAIVAIQGREAGSIVVGGVLIVIAGTKVRTSGNFEDVTNAIAVGVFNADPVTVVAQVRENTFSCNCGVLVIVARRRTETSHTDVEITTLVVDVGVCIVVACIGIGATFHNWNAGAVVLRGVGVVIDGVGIIATQDFEWIAHPVSVKVTQAVSVAVIAHVRVFALAWVNRGCIIVARGGGQTTNARVILTRAVIDIRFTFVVAR